MKPYPKYKNSGVPWLKHIPEHWEKTKTKYLFKERVEKGYPNEPLLAATQTKGVVPKGMYENRTVEAQKDLHLLKLVKQGDFVISLRSFQGGIEYAYYRGIISPAYTVMVPRKRILPEYYRHLAKSKEFISLLKTCVTGIREGQNINYEILKRTPMPIPSQEEQNQIACYLDWQTSKITKFIKAKKKLITLLKEQKQNIINEAVTKGINPDVKMKDSGVEWLGEIPAHWEVFPFTKGATEMSDYRGATPEKVDSGMFLVTAKNIGLGFMDYECSREFVTKDGYDKIMKRGMPKIGGLLLATEAPLGHAALIDREDVCLAQRVIRFRMNCSLFNEQFVLASIISKYFQDQLKCRATGSTALGIKASKLPQLRICRPPIDEQKQIAAFIEKETALIDRTITRTEREIELIQEYRARLVSDVVTGKVDVRSVEIPDFEVVDGDLGVGDDEGDVEELIGEEVEE
jgi:type I restriction enzyme S subunit